MIIIFLLTLLPFLSEALLPSKAYYIQTDQGPNRFFQFSSGPGGQFRKETILPNGTVVGAYSWKDVKGMTRVYTYTADSRGYRITQHMLLPSDKEELVTSKELDNDVSNDLAQDQERGDPDVRSNRNSKKLRLRRKVLVKRHRGGKAHPKSVKSVKVKKLGKAVEIIPYQPTLLLSNQYPGRTDQMRLVGDQGIITIPATREEENGVTNLSRTEETIKTEEDSSSLPTSVLLQRIKVQPSKQFQPTKARQDVGNAKRKRGRMVRRRRRKKNIGVSSEAPSDIFESDAGHEGVTDRVYFTPL